MISRFELQPSGLQGKRIILDFHHESSNSKICLYFNGAPSKGRKAKIPLALSKTGFNTYTFDYSGWGKSGGKFNPTEVIRSGQIAYDFVAQRTMGDLVCIGHSFGSIIAGEVKGVKHLVLLAPVLHPALLGNNRSRKEDTITDFLDGMKAYDHYYTGFDAKAWKKFLLQYQRSPKARHTMIIHGKRDRSIHFSRTQKHIEGLSKISAIYPGYTGHSGTSLIAKIPDLSPESQ